MASNHEHGTPHFHAHQLDFEAGNRRPFIIGIFLNPAFVIAELMTGFMYHSVAFLTDAGHYASGVASLVLSLVAFWMARKKSNSVFTYGFKKTTVLAALANAVVLLVVIDILGYKSVTRLL